MLYIKIASGAQLHSVLPFSFSVSFHFLSALFIPAVSFILPKRSGSCFSYVQCLNLKPYCWEIHPSKARALSNFCNNAFLKRLKLRFLKWLVSLLYIGKRRMKALEAWLTTTWFLMPAFSIPCSHHVENENVGRWDFKIHNGFISKVCSTFVMWSALSHGILIPSATSIKHICVWKESAASLVMQSKGLIKAMMVKYEILTSPRHRLHASI